MAKDSASTLTQAYFLSTQMAHSLACLPAIGLATLLSCAPGTAAAANQAADAVALVALMKLDRGVISGASAQYVRSAPSPGAAEAFCQCTEQTETTALTARIAKRVEQEFTPAEMATALQFYRSPTGQKYVLRDLQAVRPDVLRQPRPAAIFSPTELRAIDRFARSPAGAKLIVRQVIFTDQLISELMPLVDEVLARCQPAPR